MEDIGDALNDLLSRFNASKAEVESSREEKRRMFADFIHGWCPKSIARDFVKIFCVSSPLAESSIEKVLTPAALALRESNFQESALEQFLDVEIDSGVYSFELFRSDFCDALVALVREFDEFKKANGYADVLQSPSDALSALGLLGVQEILLEFGREISAKLFPRDLNGGRCDWAHR